MLPCSNENFYGNDIITLHAMNENGVQEARVPVFVEPINDPPIISAPKFISLARKEGNNGLQIFDKQRDAFEFLIMDSDIFNFVGNFFYWRNSGVIMHRRKNYFIKVTKLTNLTKKN